jgi:rfaE bifunctional protein kinase chain/domain
MIDRAVLMDAVARLSRPKVLVLGDLFLDEYLIGRAARLSREGPIPVLEFEEHRRLAGGGANPAMNVVGLGAGAIQVGVVGDDDAGRVLVGLLETEGISTEGVVVEPGRPTATKTRVVARGSLRFPQQLARIDRVDCRPLSRHVEEQVVARVRALVQRVDVVLVSDYRSGLVTSAVIDSVREAQAEGTLVCVDSQGRLGEFAGFDLVKCNHNEAAVYMARTTGARPALQTEEDFERMLMQLWRELRAGLVVVTRGAEGLSLQGAFGYRHLPAANRTEVFDVTGAGDTVVAVSALALAARQTPLVAASLANYAAGLVVRRLGVFAPSAEELSWAVQNW